MNIATILQEHAAGRPDASALIETVRRRDCMLSFAALELASSRAAALLRQAGLQPGNAVLVFHPMSIDLCVALLAMFRLGLVVVFVDPSAGKDQIERCCTLIQPSALLASSRAHIIRFWSPALRKIPLKFAIGAPVPGAISWSEIHKLEPYHEIYSCSRDTPAILTFTSGSTDRPKAALRTHGFLLAQHRVLAESLKLTPGELQLTSLPIFMLSNLASGVPSLIPDADLRSPGAINPWPVISQIHAHQPTSVVASPAFLERLVEGCAQQRLTLPCIKKIFCGGAPVFPRLIEQVQGAAPKATITTVYGSTEAEPIAYIAHDEIQSDDYARMLEGGGLLVGAPIPAISVKIVNCREDQTQSSYTEAELASVCLPAEQIGEIVVSGEHVLPGYLNGQSDEETKFRVNGRPWHRTGDAGYFDRRGRLWLLGRCGACIEDTYGVLYPFAAECAVYQRPAVRRAAVVSHKGQRILLVELREKAKKSDLKSLQDSIPWAHVDEVQVVSCLPVDKRHNSKIEYSTLKNLLRP